jgi:hypothetical protein
MCSRYSSSRSSSSSREGVELGAIEGVFAQASVGIGVVAVVREEAMIVAGAEVVEVARVRADVVARGGVGAFAVAKE